MSWNKTAIVILSITALSLEDILELLGIIIDSKLTFENHINKIYEKGNQKSKKFLIIWDALLDLVLSVQFKKREKHIHGGVLVFVKVLASATTV